MNVGFTGIFDRRFWCSEIKCLPNWPGFIARRGKSALRYDLPVGESFLYLLSGIMFASMFKIAPYCRFAAVNRSFDE
jgi:hypothetical protein